MELNQHFAELYFESYGENPSKEAQDAYDYFFSDISEKAFYDAILTLVTYAKNEHQLGVVGAGRLEDLLHAGSNEIYIKVKEELKVNKGLRKALSHVWVDDEDPSYNHFIKIESQYLKR